MDYQEKLTDKLEDVMHKWFALISMVVLSVGATGVCFAQEPVIAAESGLVYEDVQIGTGATAEVGKIVVIHLTGWLDDQGQKGENLFLRVIWVSPYHSGLGPK